MPHQEWDVPHWECPFSPEMGMCFTGNEDVPHREWGCTSPGIHILTGNAHSLYLVMMVIDNNNSRTFRPVANMIVGKAEINASG